MKTDIEKRYAKLMKIASQKIAGLQAELDSLKQNQQEPVAVIGMACRFPGGADTPDQLWQLLKNGVDTIDQPPLKRWQLLGMSGPAGQPDARPLYGGFINNIDQFDAQFFGISPREAKSLDPQQRLLLEIGWEALEHAAIAPGSLQGSATGVFVGVTSSDYQYLFNRRFDTPRKPQADSNAGVYLITGNSLSAVAGRLSYNLGLTGPAVITDTSCSSSLVTVHQACQSLRSRECDLALAGGISLMIRIDSLARYFAGKVFTADGRCKAFDARADSFGRGEGCGLIVLKQLSEAVADGDNILAVIKGSMINQDGRTNGMTAPNGTAQQAVIRQALTRSRVEPGQVGYIEAHGTGTAIGDPVEIEALNAVFGKRTEPLWVGSVKSNMGHLEGAAGIAGLMKAILALQHRQIPPSLHFNRPNPYIDWQSSPVQIPTQLTPWTENNTPRIAGVSSFGFSGTNAHVVLAQAPPPSPRSDAGASERPSERSAFYADRKPGGDAERPNAHSNAERWNETGEKTEQEYLLPLSAKTPEALEALAGRYHDYLLNHPDINLGDLCYTAQTGRTHFRHRLSIIADSPVMMQTKLKAFAQGKISSGVSQGQQIGYQITSGLRPDSQNSQQTLESLGALYAQGVQIDWADFNQGRQFQKITLPTYPFQRQSYWLDIPPAHPQPQKLAPLIDRMIKLPQHNQTIFETEVSIANIPFLTDHRVYDTLVMPGAAYVTMALQAINLIGNFLSYRVDDVVLLAPLIISNGESRTTQLILTATAGEQYEFQLISFGDNASQAESVIHATGQIKIDAQSPRQISLAEVQNSCDKRVDLEVRSADLRQQQVAFGPNFQWLAEVWQPADGNPAKEALGKLQRPAVVDQATDVLHPGLLDACFQVAGFAHPSETKNDAGQDAVWLPFAIEQVRFYRPINGDQWWCQAQQVAAQRWNIQLLDTDGQVIAGITGFQVRATTPKTMFKTDVWRKWLYTIDWQPTPLFGLPPDYLSAPTRIRQTASEMVLDSSELLSNFPTATEMQRYQTALNQMEAVSVEYIVETFAAAGIPLDKPAQTDENAEGWRIDQLAQQLGVIPAYRRLLERLLAILVEAGLLEQEGEVWRLAQNSSAAQNLTSDMSTLMAQYGDVAGPELSGLKRCGENLGQVLRGAQNPLALLFPEGVMSANKESSAANQSSPAVQVMNHRVQQAVLAAIEQLPAKRGLRVLEVGAGTGSTTAWLLPQLPANQTEYVFTDISAAFLPGAREKFAAYDFVQYKTLDLEQSPLEQNFAVHHYDIVMAANVLHATKNLDETLAHIRQVLAPGGILILWETTTRQRRVDLTFGLTDGWWRFADHRTEHPLLNEAQWQNLLLDSGFEDVATLSDEMLGQSVIVAQTPSLTRLPSPSGRGAGGEGLSQKRPWLIFTDQSSLGQMLADELSNRGEQPVLVQPGPDYRKINETTFTLNPTSPAGYQQLIEAAPNVYGVVYLWGFSISKFAVGQHPYARPQRHRDASATQNMDIPETVDLETAAVQGCNSVLHLVQALLQAEEQPAGLWLVTNQAQAVHPDDTLEGVVQASLWGLGRNVALEAPQLHCACIDLDAPNDNLALAQQAVLLGNELLKRATDINEPQVAFRGSTRYVPRLTDYDQPATEAGTSSLVIPNEPFQLQSTKPGTLGNLALLPMPRRLPVANEVEIRVRATGLNFIDVLDALGLLPFQRAGGLGGECAGEVMAVGEDVQDIQPGDRVMAMAPGCFSQYITVTADMAIALPDNLGFAEAATIPVNFLTAYNALHRIGHISSGDRVLVHAAAGGTGMAAVKIAQLAGAEVFATAGPGKWEALKALGVEHIYNSRTLDFAGQILADTDGQGVDVALNSLTGEGFVEKSLSVLARQGRFLEIAKLNVWSDEQANALRPDVSYHLVDLPLEPGYLRSMLIELMSQFEAGALTPLTYTSFPVQEAGDAFRFMQQAKHIGKVVVTQDEEPETVIQPKGTYLITGGLSGLGLLVARWLVEQGARHLMLVGRSRPTPEAQSQLDAMAELGAVVTVAQADVTSKDQLADALAKIEAAYPLRGVIHSVGVLDNAPLPQQNEARLRKVMAPKIQGAWNLHQLTQDMPLDFFVLFSSAIGLFGNQGQANHAAANVFLDTFAAYRRAQTLPALSIDWGAWSEIGAAAETINQIKGQMAAQGLGVISPTNGLEIFACLLNQNSPHIAVLPIDWPRFLAHQEIISPLLKNISDAAQRPLPAHPSPVSTESEAQGLFRQHLEKAPARKRPEMLMAHLHALIAKVLGLGPDEAIAPQQGLMELGLDSLMAIELRNHLGNSLDYQLSATLLFDYPTLEALTEYLILVMFDDPVAENETDDISPNNDDALPAEEIQTTNLDDLAEDELAALLAQEIENLKQTQ